ncbi:MAG: hypothetical protein DSZ10_03060 [Sulfurovum sp.]|nr:MAG: hypothetical protein DSZ10_03060 [Sulfurovum sp.]
MKYEVIDSRYTKLLANIKEYFDQSDTLIWDRRNKIKVIDFFDEKLVVKSFKKPHLINRVAYSFFRDSKAKRSYENSLKIDAFVPKAIGYVEHDQFSLLKESYFVSEYYPCDFTIREVLTRKDFVDKTSILESFARFSYRLHEMGAEHLDYSPGNILIKKYAGEYHFKVIDINRMRFGRMTPQQRLENFARLWASEEDLGTISRSYASLLEIDPAMAESWALEASKKHKNKVNLKKRIKGKEIVD